MPAVRLASVEGSCVVMCDTYQGSEWMSEQADEFLCGREREGETREWNTEKANKVCGD